MSATPTELTAQTAPLENTELLDRPTPTANPAQLAIAVEAARQLADPERHRPDPWPLSQAYYGRICDTR